MSSVAITLFVLRSRNIEKAADFYSCLGLEFSEHRHGSGPLHLAAEVGGCVFELYPLLNEADSTLGTRIGFTVNSVDEALAAIGRFVDAVVADPRDSEWGRRAVVKDPDGHRVELLQR